MSNCLWFSIPNVAVFGFRHTSKPNNYKIGAAQQNIKHSTLKTISVFRERGSAVKKQEENMMFSYEKKKNGGKKILLKMNKKTAFVVVFSIGMFMPDSAFKEIASYVIEHIVK